LSNAFIVFSIGIILLFIGRYLWSKGDSKEPFFLTLLGAVIDVFTLQFFSSYRGASLLVYLIGSLLIILSIAYVVKLMI
jgi:hypothetical protein